MSYLYSQVLEIEKADEEEINFGALQNVRAKPVAS